MAKSILAFVHIEKAAGTTLNHILRLNFLFRHCDVRPLTQEKTDIFSCSDMGKYLQINPFIASISGHSVKPYSNLKEKYNIKYVTLFRDPVQRYVSQYLYLTRINRISYPFKVFLEQEKYCNLQTKKMTGSDDVQLAKKIIETSFFLVGITEEFDNFIVQLSQSLAPIDFLPFYCSQNLLLGTDIQKKDIIQEYYKNICVRNEADIELYDYIKKQLLPEQLSKFDTEIQDQILLFKTINSSFKKNYKRYADYIYRKLYLDPVTGMVRSSNGLPKLGSYTQC